ARFGARPLHTPSEPTQLAELPRQPADQLAPRGAAVRPAEEGEDVADASGGLSPAKLLHALRRRWLIAVPLATAVAVAVGWVAAQRITPVYTARTMLHVSAQRQSILFDGLDGQTSAGNAQRNQIATVKSRLVRQSALR